MSYIIDKTFEFCYGHRVHTQRLNGKFSDNLKCACRHLHGHEGKMQVFLTADHLDDTGMVTDFRHLEWLKKWIDAHIDHQFILDRNDPLYNQMIGTKTLLPVFVTDSNLIAGYKVDLTLEEEGTPQYEYLEGFLIVDFVPTSENLCSWMSKIVQEKMQHLNVTVQRVEWWETPKSRSTFINTI